MLPRQFNFSNQQGETAMTTTTTRKDESEQEQDAIEMLMADHKKVKKLFGNFETHKDDGDDEDKSAIVKLICNELKIHTTLEEEIFYPAVRKAIQDSALMDEALVEIQILEVVQADVLGCIPAQAGGRLPVGDAQPEHHQRWNQEDREQRELRG
jgi:hypothetical protein